MKGKVKWFNREKGYGFLEGEDGKEYFVHHTSVPEGAFLRENDPVTFEPTETDKGIQAKDIALGEADDSAAEAEEPAEAEENVESSE